IQSALERLMEGRTTLIAAHRLSSVIGADRIMVLDRGRVAESGTHAELMARRGPYWRLMSPQVESAARPDLVIAVDGRRAESDPAETDGTGPPSTDRSAVRAAEVGWRQALPILSRLIRGYRARLVTTFVLGIARVAAIIAVGVPLAVALWPVLVYAALSPVLRRPHIDRLGWRAREVSGDLTAHTVDSIQGIAEVVAFRRGGARGEDLAARARAYLAARMPF